MDSLEVTMQDVLKLCEKRPDIGLLIENEAPKRKVQELAAYKEPAADGHSSYEVPDKQPAEA
jgi:hypothetical protein